VQLDAALDVAAQFSTSDVLLFLRPTVTAVFGCAQSDPGAGKGTHNCRDRDVLVIHGYHFSPFPAATTSRSAIALRGWSQT